MLMMTMMRKSSRQRQSLAAFLGILVMLLINSWYTRPVLAGTSLKKASLIPLWSPQSQFAGYYVALDKGIYARHGIDLTILKGGAGHSPAQSLKNGQADFAVLWLTTALHHRFAGTKLVNVSQIIQRSSMMLISRKSSGIRKERRSGCGEKSFLSRLAPYLHNAVSRSGKFLSPIP
jgi:NitT/TauT family transport system substrate-binding protein